MIKKDFSCTYFIWSVNCVHTYMYTFIVCWWGKYENLFTHEYHIPFGRCCCPRGIWYSWVNTISYFLNPHDINVLLYRMKPRKHIYVKYCWQTYFKSIETLSQIFKNHIVTVACKWCVPSTSDVFLSKNDRTPKSIIFPEGNARGEYDTRGWIIFRPVIC